MEFTFNDDQEAAAGAPSAAFLAEQAPSTYVRAMIDDDRGVTDEVWQQLVDLGWPALLVPEDARRSRARAGRHGRGAWRRWAGVPFPGPFLSSAVLATLAASASASTTGSPSLASGTTRGTVALDEDGPRRRRRPRPHPGQPQVRPLAAHRREAGGARRPHRRLGAGRRPAPQQGIGTFLRRGAARRELVPDVGRHPQGGAARARRQPRRSRSDPTAITPRLAARRRRRERRAVRRAARLDGGGASTSPSSTPRSACSSTGRSPRSRRSSTRRPTCCTASSSSRVGTHYAAWASDVDDPVRAEAAAMAKAYVGRGGQRGHAASASRSTAASASPGTATPTSTTGGPSRTTCCSATTASTANEWRISCSMPCELPAQPRRLVSPAPGPRDRRDAACR